MALGWYFLSPLYKKHAQFDLLETGRDLKLWLCFATTQMLRELRRIRPAGDRWNSGARTGFCGSAQKRNTRRQSDGTAFENCFGGWFLCSWKATTSNLPGRRRSGEEIIHASLLSYSQAAQPLISSMIPSSRL